MLYLWVNERIWDGEEFECLLIRSSVCFDQIPETIRFCLCQHVARIPSNMLCARRTTATLILQMQFDWKMNKSFEIKWLFSAEEG